MRQDGGYRPIFLCGGGGGLLKTDNEIVIESHVIIGFFIAFIIGLLDWL